MRFPDARILIFARAPVPGRVKTRLVPVLGAEGACALYVDCLKQTVALACDAALAPVSLHCTPDASHPLFTRLAEKYPLTLAVQQGVNLGARMAAAARRALTHASAALLIGSDVPPLGARHLSEALQRLYEGDAVVMAPAEDGGYVLLGLRQPQPQLFTDMPWGSDRVAELTRWRCRRMGLRLGELETLWDLDRPEDLARMSLGKL
ncbi:MAG: glycosyltransferase [Gammaproteobacteria bacterium]|nr:MAG: glycosyltransferase [Gammaproteobacteria bacterium]